MGAVREAAKYETRTIKYAAYDQVNRKLRRQGHEWNDEQTDGSKVADLLEGVAKDLDPTIVVEPVCWHGVPTKLGCFECDSDKRWRYR